MAPSSYAAISHKFTGNKIEGVTKYCCGCSCRRTSVAGCSNLQ